jgi:hypothetical protein
MMASSSEQTVYAMESLQGERPGETESPSADCERTGNVAQPTETSLPPTDHGRDAYLTLMCCTLAQLPIWGT